MPIYAHFGKNEHKRKKKKALNVGLFSLVAGEESFFLTLPEFQPLFGANKTII
jgi:hypothetical protein